MNYILKVFSLIVLLGLSHTHCAQAKQNKKSKTRRFIKRALPGAAIGGLTTGLVWGGKWTPLGIVAGGLTSAAIASAFSDDEDDLENYKHK